MTQRKIIMSDLRQQSALCSADKPIVIVSDDADIPSLRVVEVYPDTCDEEGKGNSTFKIKVEQK